MANLTTSENIIRQHWLSTELAVDRILDFEERFGKDHLFLACHAALAFILTPELVNLIRINFLYEKNLDWFAEADFLLSSLCFEIEDGLYQVEPRVREVLLIELENEFGKNRLTKLADFLLSYLENKRNQSFSIELTQLQKWIGESYFDSERIAKELEEILLPKNDLANQLANQIQVITAIEILSNSLAITSSYKTLVEQSKKLACVIYNYEEIEEELIPLEDTLIKPSQHLDKSLVLIKSDDAIGSGIIISNFGLAIFYYPNFFSQIEQRAIKSISLRTKEDWKEIPYTNNIEFCIRQDKDSQEYKDTVSSNMHLVRLSIDTDSHKLNTLTNLQVSQNVKDGDEVTIIVYDPNHEKGFNELLGIAIDCHNHFHIQINGYSSYIGGSVFNKEGHLVGIITEVAENANDMVVSFIPHSIIGLINQNLINQNLLTQYYLNYTTIFNELANTSFLEEISVKMSSLKYIEEQISTLLPLEEFKNWKKHNNRFVHLLQKGSQDWNSWRVVAQSEIIDFSQQDLSEYNFNLTSINFNGVILKEANLSGIDLTTANLINSDLSAAILNTTKLNSANLSKTKLVKAQLQGNKIFNADFSGVDFTECDLTDTTLENVILDKANFTRANLNKTQFINCKLEGTDFTESYWSETKLVDSDLHNAKGIISINHQILSTLLFSKPTDISHIPQEFLNHCQPKTYKLKVAFVDIDSNTAFLPTLAKLANQAQDYYYFQISYISTPDKSYIRTNFYGQETSPQTFLPVLEDDLTDLPTKLQVDLVCCLTSNMIAFEVNGSLQWNYFSCELISNKNVFFISTYDLDKYAQQADTTLAKAVLFLTLSELIFLESNGNINYHSETYGCLFDECNDRDSITHGLSKTTFDHQECRKKFNDLNQLDAVDSLIALKFASPINQIEADKETIKQLFEKASELWKIAKFEDVLNLYDKIISISEPYSKNRDIYFIEMLVATTMTKGLKLKDLEELEEALIYIDRAINYCKQDSKLDNKRATALNNKAGILTDLGHYSEAIVSCDIGISIIKPVKQLKLEEIQVLAGLIGNKGLVLNNLENLSEALRCYDEAISVCEEFSKKIPINLYNVFASLLHNKAIVLSKIDNYFEALSLQQRAKLYYKELVDKKGEEGLPNVAEVLVGMGLSYYGLKNFQESNSCYDSAIHILNQLIEKGHSGLKNKLARAMHNKSIVLKDESKFSEALTLCDDVIKIRLTLVEKNNRPHLSGDLASTFLAKGGVLQEFDKLLEADECYDKALAIYEELVKSQGYVEFNEPLAMVYNKKANILKELNQQEKAIPYYDQAIFYYNYLIEEKEQKHLFKTLAQSFSNKALTLWDVKLKDEAIEYFDKAIEILRRLVKQEQKIEIEGNSANILINNVILLNSLQGSLVERLANTLINKANLLNEMESLEAITYCDEATEYYRLLLHNKEEVNIIKSFLGAYNIKANISVKSGDVSKAINYIDEAITFTEKLKNDTYANITKERTMLLSNKGYYLALTSRFSEALRTLDSVIDLYNTLLKDHSKIIKREQLQLANNFAKTLIYKGNTLFELKRFQDSLDSYNQAIHWQEFSMKGGIHQPLQELLEDIWLRVQVQIKLKYWDDVVSDIKQAHNLVKSSLELDDPYTSIECLKWKYFCDSVNSLLENEQQQIHSRLDENIINSLNLWKQPQQHINQEIINPKTKYWLLRTNPHITEVTKTYEGREWYYEVVPNKAISQGHIVYFWRNSEEDIYGWGEVIDNPALSESFSLDPNKKVSLKVRIKVMSSDSINKQAIEHSIPEILNLINNSHIGLGVIPLSYLQIIGLNKLYPASRMIPPVDPTPFEPTLLNDNTKENITKNIEIERNIEILANALSNSDENERSKAVEALGEINNERSIRLLIKALSDPSGRVCNSAVAAIAKIGSDKVIDLLSDTLSTSHTDSYLNITRTLIKIGTDKAIEALVSKLSSPKRELRCCVALMLEYSDSSKATEALINSLSDPDTEVRLRAAFSLSKVNNPKAINMLFSFLHNPDSHIRSQAAVALGRVKTNESVDALIAALSDRDLHVRSTVAQSLERIGSKRTIKPLTKSLSDSEHSVRSSAEAALKQIRNHNSLTIDKRCLVLIQTTEGIGSGIVVSPYGHILTCYHNLYDPTTSAKIDIKEITPIITSEDFPNGRPDYPIVNTLKNISLITPQEDLRFARKYDIIALRININTPYYAKLSNNRPVHNELVSLLGLDTGYSNSIRYVPNQSVLDLFPGDQQTTEYFRIHSPAFQGMSGGGVFNSNNELIGIIRNTNFSRKDEILASFVDYEKIYDWVPTFTISSTASSQQQKQYIQEDIPKIIFNSPQIIDVSVKKLKEVISKVQILLLTMTNLERKALLSEMIPLPGEKAILEGAISNITYRIGQFGNYCVAYTESIMANGGRHSATLTAERAINELKPKAVFLLGIAFGIDRTKQKLGDVLIAESIFPYEYQKLNSDFAIHKGQAIPCSHILSEPFRMRRDDWQPTHNGQSFDVKVHQGLVLSGEKVVNSKEFRDKLLKAFPTAIGGEMEGAGAYAAVTSPTEVILIKSISDWADGDKNDDAQPFAAFTAVSLAKHVLSKPDLYPLITSISQLQGKETTNFETSESGDFLLKEQQTQLFNVIEVKSGLDNPFTYRGGINNKNDFFGRDEEQRIIRAFLKNKQNCQIIGPRRIGKTSLLLQVERSVSEWLKQVNIAYLDLQGPECFTLSGLLNKAGKRLGSNTPINDLVGFSSFIENALSKKLHLILCLDEFEELLNRPKEFTRELFLTLRSCGQLGLSIITSSMQSLSQLIDQGDPSSPFYNTFPQTVLGNFNNSDSEDFLNIYRMDVSPFTEEEKKVILDFAKGHPLALQVACYHIIECRRKNESVASAIHKAEEDMKSYLPRGDWTGNNYL